MLAGIPPESRNRVSEITLDPGIEELQNFPTAFLPLGFLMNYLIGASLLSLMRSNETVKDVTDGVFPESSQHSTRWLPRLHQ